MEIIDHTQDIIHSLVDLVVFREMKETGALKQLPNIGQVLTFPVVKDPKLLGSCCLLNSRLSVIFCSKLSYWGSISTATESLSKLTFETEPDHLHLL